MFIGHNAYWKKSADIGADKSNLEFTIKIDHVLFLFSACW